MSNNIYELTDDEQNLLEILNAELMAAQAQYNRVRGMYAESIERIRKKRDLSEDMICLNNEGRVWFLEKTKQPAPPQDNKKATGKGKKEGGK